MSRGTVYNKITSEESIDKILPANKELMNDYLDYLKSIDRSPNTIDQYKSDLVIFFVWNLENNENKKFIDITKREFARFQSHALNEWKWSSNRIRRVKSVLSSISSYVENILDEEEEFKDYRSIVKKIENPVKEPVREKTIISDEEVKMILDALVKEKKYQCACSFALAAFSGARKSELLRFKVHYFDDENIMESAALYKTPEKIKTKGRGSSGKMVFKYTLLEFKPYLDLWMEERKRLGIENEMIFVKEDGNLLTADQLDTYAKYITKLLGRPFYYHSLRHQLTSRLFRLGLPADVIKEFFQWSSIEMTALYNDNEASDSFGKYFTSEGIKGAEVKTLADL